MPEKELHQANTVVDRVMNGIINDIIAGKIKPGEKLVQQLPESFQARWIRFVSDTDTKATAWLNYR